MLKKYNLNQNKKFRQVTVLVVVLLVASIGTYLLSSSHAQTPFVSATADSGTVANPAASQPCTGSSDGNCVAFGGGGSSNAGVPFIGVIGYEGWGPGVASYLYNDGFRWTRDDATSGAYQPGTQIDTDLNAGHNVIIVLPTDTNQAMSWMQAYKSYGARVLYEFWNEPWTNSNGPAAIPTAVYAQEYEAAYNAKHAAGITQPLLFMTIGDAYSSDGQTWLQRAMNPSSCSGSVCGNPNLKVDGFSMHPYGAANYEDPSRSFGLNALVDMHNQAVSMGFTDTPWYVTEWGVSLNPKQTDGNSSTSNCMVDGQYAKSYADQATCITAGYNQMISYGDGANGTWLKGIEYYYLHDDSNYWSGLVTDPYTCTEDPAGDPIVCARDVSGEPAGPETGNLPTPVTPRPAYTALKAFLTNH